MTKFMTKFLKNLSCSPQIRLVKNRLKCTKKAACIQQTSDFSGTGDERIENSYKNPITCLFTVFAGFRDKFCDKKNRQHIAADSRS